MFSELNTYPTYPLPTLRGLPHDRTRARLEAEVARWAFLVRLFHPLPHAGLSRRTNIAITVKPPRAIMAGLMKNTGIVLRCALLVVLAVACIAPSKTNGTAPSEPDLARMQQIIQSQVEAHKFMGTVLVERDGKVLLDQGYAYANLEWNIPNSPTTKFRLGSVTKQFT